jgi:hypothetical protein
MSRFATWIGKNADGLIGLVLAACIAILAWADRIESAAAVVIRRGRRVGDHPKSHPW